VHTGGETKRTSAARNYIMRARRNMFSKLMSHSLTSEGGVTIVPQATLPKMNVKSYFCCAHACIGRTGQPTPVQGASGWVASLL
jgi:hypothetical protein